jgi:hypothetical protein
VSSPGSTPDDDEVVATPNGAGNPQWDHVKESVCHAAQETVRRVLFLLITLILLASDFVFLACAFGLTIAASWLTRQFDHLTGLARWSLIWIEWTLTLGFTVTVVWHTFLDVWGIVRRGWETRND